MTTLSNFNIATHDVKACVVSFSVSKKLCGNSTFKAVLAKNLMDAIYVPASNDDIYIEYTTAGATAYKIFYGKIRKVTPVGKFYNIEGNHKFLAAYENKITLAHVGATNHDHIMENMLDAASGIFGGTGFTVTNTVDNHNSITGGYNIQSSLSMDQLKKLMWFGAAGYPSVFFPSNIANATILLQDFAENVPGTDIVFSNALGNLIGKVVSSSTQDNIINVVTTAHAGGRHNSTDATYDASASVTAYGGRGTNIYRPEISTNADASLTEDCIRAFYDGAYTMVSCKVKHSYLQNETYPVINTVYTITDTINATTYTDYNCIEHTINWPSFIDDIKLGWIEPDFATFLSNSASSSNRLGQDSAGINVFVKAHRITSAQTIPTAPNGGGYVIFNGEDVDVGSNYDHTSGIFTAPINGYYNVEYEVSVSSINVGRYVYLSISNEGVTENKRPYLNSSIYVVDGLKFVGATSVKMSAGDHLAIYGIYDIIAEPPTDTATFVIDYGGVEVSRLTISLISGY
jgi:hypothetical protein